VEVSWGGQAETWTAGYDALDRRVFKALGGARTDYYWDGDRLAAEIGPGGAVRLYVYPSAEAIVPLLFVDYDHVDAAPESGRAHYVFGNQIGVPLHIEDQTGGVVWRAEHVEPYGAVTVAPGAALAYAPRFPGHYFDEETGLHYNRYRYYSPRLGRYLQPDPIGQRGGINVYAYAPNPLVDVDVLGLTKCSLPTRMKHSADAFAHPHEDGPPPVPPKDKPAEDKELPLPPPPKEAFDEQYAAAKKIASEEDMPVGRKTFWSRSGGDPASEYAHANGLARLEETTLGKDLDAAYKAPVAGEWSLAKGVNDGPLDWTGPDGGRALWVGASIRYAEAAEGDVHAFVEKSDLKTVFQTDELPTLLKNPKVTSIAFHYDDPSKGLMGTWTRTGPNPTDWTGDPVINTGAPIHLGTFLHGVSSGP
jgi:RHS repeat-associated protein